MHIIARDSLLMSRLTPELAEAMLAAPPDGDDRAARYTAALVLLREATRLERFACLNYHSPVFEPTILRAARLRRVAQRGY